MNVASYIPDLQMAPAAPGVCFGKFTVMNRLQLHTERDGESRFSVLCNGKAQKMTDGMIKTGVSESRKAIHEEVVSILKGGRTRGESKDESVAAVSTTAREVCMMVERVLDDGIHLPVGAEQQMVIIDGSQDL